MSRRKTTSLARPAASELVQMALPAVAVLGAAAIDPVLMLPLGAFCAMAYVTTFMARRLYREFSAGVSPSH